MSDQKRENIRQSGICSGKLPDIDGLKLGG